MQNIPPRGAEVVVNPFEDLFHDLVVYSVILDRFGFITAVNDQWKALVGAGKSVLPHLDKALPDFGVGENYLRLCAFADPLSPRLITGISQVLAGEVDCITILYPAGPAAQPCWYLLFGFPHLTETGRAALLHVDVTTVFGQLAKSRRQRIAPGDLSVEECAAEPTLAGPQLEGLTETAEQSILAAIAATREGGASIGQIRTAAPDDERQAALSKRQWEVLSLMTNGLTNIEIARRLGLSPNTVKIHVSGILARLGLPSRTQAVHWALTRGRVEKR